MPMAVSIPPGASTAPSAIPHHSFDVQRSRMNNNEPRYLTAKWVAEHQSQRCPYALEAGHYELFCREWGDRVEVTRANLIRAAELGLRADWLAEQILDADDLARFHEALCPAEDASKQGQLES
jgi:hypothetical protein